MIELSKRQGPIHLLYVTTSDGSNLQYYRIKCLGVTEHCQSFKPCDCPESQPNDENYFEYQGDDEAHGVVHHYLNSEWMIPNPEQCFFELVPEEVADTARDMPTFDGLDRPMPGVYLVETVWESGDAEDGFHLNWTGAARMRMQGNLFNGTLPHPTGVYVGRRQPHWRDTPWGNPYKPGLVDAATGEPIRDVEHAVQVFEQQKLSDPAFVDAVRTELACKVLVCWCTPGRPCHGDSLLLAANLVRSTRP